MQCIQAKRIAQCKPEACSTLCVNCPVTHQKNSKVSEMITATRYFHLSFTEYSTAAVVPCTKAICIRSGARIHYIIYLYIIAAVHFNCSPSAVKFQNRQLVLLPSSLARCKTKETMNSTWWTYMQVLVLLLHTFLPLIL